jgi:hypothetical protein
MIPDQPVYQASMVTTPHSRPTHLPNLWVSAPTTFEQPESLDLEWDAPKDIAEVQLLFDSSLHFHFSQSWQGYPVRGIPSVIRDYRIIAGYDDGSTTILADVAGNYQRNRRHRMVVGGVRRLRVEIRATNGLTRAQIYGLRVITSEANPLRIP